MKRSAVLVIVLGHGGVTSAAKGPHYDAKSGIPAWVDIDTPKQYYKATSSRGETWNLVMSDEFNRPGRNFTAGVDPMWTAIEMADGVNAALEYYSVNMTETVMEPDGRGVFRIVTKHDDISFRVYNPYKTPPGFQQSRMYYRSGMLQSWNKFCMQGGLIEVMCQQPGVTGANNPDASNPQARVIGIYYPTWPGVWLLGNLGRALFLSSTTRMWPWSYDVCDKNLEKDQRISACDSNPGFGLNPNQGRGAPEIDILEGGGAAISSSVQIAPGMPDEYRPVFPADDNNAYSSFDVNGDRGPVDGKAGTGLYWGINTKGQCFPVMNGYNGAYLCDPYTTNAKCTAPLHSDGNSNGNNISPFSYQMDAISANWPVEFAAYSGYLKYQLEWVMGRQGYVRWMIDGVPLFEIPAESLENPPQNAAMSNPKKLMIEEPLYLIFNTALSTSWGTQPPNPGKPCRGDGRDDKVNRVCDAFPLYLKIDYIRVWQNTSTMSVGCDPASHPTRLWIDGHKSDYEDVDNPNIDVDGNAFCTDNADCTLAGSIVTGSCSDTKRCVCSAPAVRIHLPNAPRFHACCRYGAVHDARQIEDRSAGRHPQDRWDLPLSLSSSFQSWRPLAQP
ncbi:hypothetical protein DYB32_009148 [Aphanomyces invadans]|uniref:GH16 domain-containing protein n=1 Tax=Aphanomyces invadans TaxID=157072 RepID=A0A418AJ85_9STRA|nr:hypothetical protein DYB32_009148 [Aphanomyces invadans]